MDNHHDLKLVAGNSGQNFALYSDKVFKFIKRRTNDPHSDIIVNHLWFYAPSTNFTEFIEKCLKLRRKCKIQGFPSFARTLKLGLNSCVGICSKKNHETYCRPVMSMNQEISDYLRKQNINQLIHIDSIQGYRGRSAVLSQSPPRPIKINQYFKNQMFLALSHDILQRSKLILLRLFDIFDKYFDPAKFLLIYVNVDSVMAVTSSQDCNVLDCVYHEKRGEFEREVYSRIFITDRDGEQRETAGLLQCDFIKIAPFNFTSRHILHFSLSTQLPASQNPLESHAQSHRSTAAVLRGDCDYDYCEPF